jgi:hypothetical protein
LGNRFQEKNSIKFELKKKEFCAKKYFEIALAILLFTHPKKYKRLENLK